MTHLLLALAALTGAAANDHPPADNAKPATLVRGLGDVHHPVSTRNKEAQQFFDQGLAFLYAFNHDEAARSFRRAAELDPELAMAYWGIALSVGPNYNDEGNAERRKAAHEAIQKAVKLCKNLPNQEQLYIYALASRYSDDPRADPKKLGVAYAAAMKAVSRRYPDDLDAATLYAESLMNLRPWQLYDRKGEPAEGTPEIVAVLESVLRRNPHHTGANHYYIHAVEASRTPERALPSAARLGKLAPASGHLVHMPSHIYIRVGDYEKAARANEEAIRVDRDYLYLKGAAAKGIYPMMYYSHNIHFLAVSRTMQGRRQQAQEAADALADHVRPHVRAMPMLEGFLVTPTLVQARFRRWDDLVKSPAPERELVLTTAVWHFGRGLAHASNGRPEEALKERQAFAAARGRLPADAKIGMLNMAKDVLDIAEDTLDARIALAKGDRKLAIKLLTRAAERVDGLNYTEPPDWYLPVRETLGAVLIADGDPAAAEKVFREDLERNPRHGRSLFGLMESLKRQKKDYDARMVEQQFRAAWKDAEPKELRLGDL